MQKQTSGQQPLVYFLLVVTFLFGCTSKNEDFSYAISQHQDTSLTRLPEIVSGLPFYSPKTLSPFWAEESDPKEMVSIPKFELRDQNDKRVSEKLFSRKNTIVGFVFTSCSGFCPTLVEKMKKIKSKVNNKNFQYVFFTVDPEVDTPGVLKKYMKKHYVKGQNWTFITGDKKTIYQLIKILLLVKCDS